MNADRTFELIFRFDGHLMLNDISQTFLLDCVPVRHLEPMSAKISVNSEANHYQIPLDSTKQLFKLNHVYTSTEPEQERGQPYRYLPIKEFIPTAHFLPDAEFLYYYQLRTECDILQRTLQHLHFFDCNGKPAENLPPQSILCQFTGYRTQAANLGIGAINQLGENASGLKVSNITPVSACHPPITEDKEDRSNWTIISFLSMSPWMAFHTDSLKDLIRLFDFSYDQSLSKRIQEHIDGIVQLRFLLRPVIKQTYPGTYRRYRSAGQHPNRSSGQRGSSAGPSTRPDIEPGLLRQSGGDASVQSGGVTPDDAFHQHESFCDDESD